MINSFIPIQATRDGSAHHSVPVFSLAKSPRGCKVSSRLDAALNNLRSSRLR